MAAICQNGSAMTDPFASPRARARARRHLAAAAVLGLALAVAAGCRGGGGGTPAQAATPDLVLLVTAGLRAGAFDGAEQAFVDGLGDPPTHRYAAAYCQSLAPLTSLVSMLSGRYPSAVPFCGLHSRDASADERLWCASLPADRHYLPGVLSVYGYRSALLTAGLAGDDIFGGVFDHSTSISAPGEAVPWDDLGRAARDWWADSAGTPRLLVIVVADPGLDRHPALAVTGGTTTVQDETGKRHRVIEASEAVPAYVEALGEVGTRLGAIVDALDDGGRPRWLAATSLHGMSVGERTGTADASDTQIDWQLSHLAHHIILDRTVHVPLILRGPDGGGTRTIDTPVELVDVYPTFLSLAGAAPAAGLPGGDLLAGADGGGAYTEFGDMLAIRQGDHLLTFRAYVPDHSSLDPAVTDRLRLESVDGEKYSLFDVVADPLQLHNRVHHEWDTTLILRDTIVGIRQGMGAPPDGSLGNDRVRALRLHAREGYW